MIGACGRSERATGALVPENSAPSAPTSVAPEVRPAPEGNNAPAPSAAPPVKLGSTLSAVATGDALGLHLEADALTYCDDRGGRAVDLRTGLESARDRPCEKHEERNRACDGIDVVDRVREPGPGPNDIIDLKNGHSQPVHGHITDCAFSTGVLLFASWNEIVAIDMKTNRRDLKSKEGGPLIAINEAWLAWSDGKKVFAEHR